MPTKGWPSKIHRDFGEFPMNISKLLNFGETGWMWKFLTIFVKNSVALERVVVDHRHRDCPDNRPLCGYLLGEDPDSKFFLRKGSGHFYLNMLNSYLFRRGDVPITINLDRRINVA
ncbi:OLC1v1006119C1 [Oldenlandia corymbosa var. corymbosa]|uniref:OLC1v1006119C1 n=1 Tax=Oldenlandia corymbosa var. corymbosa TaxID=529605 RepID=A0AAV1DGA6_OLDCO|nr:OLC1v1006119C1 [Oldenlandia corymbosa var. corymbosa]